MKKTFFAIFVSFLTIFSANSAENEKRVFVTQDQALMNHIQKYMARFQNDECFRNVYGVIPWHYLNKYYLNELDPYVINIDYLTSNDLGGNQKKPLYSWITGRYLHYHGFSNQWREDLFNTIAPQWRKNEFQKGQTGYFFTEKEIAALDKKYSKEIQTYKKSRMIFDLYTFYMVTTAHPDKVSNATMEKYLKELVIKSGSNRNAILEDLNKFKTRIQQPDSPYAFILQDGEQYIMCKNMN